MKKITARYFYSPICSEAFASLDRLKNLFLKYQEYIDFQALNIFGCNLQSGFSWFPIEKELVDSIINNGEYPLLYGKLFIQGNEIKGFPPSKTMISKILKDYGVSFQEDDYQFDYGKANKMKFKCDREEFKIKKYDLKNLGDSCIICTKYNSFIDEINYIQENWAKYENLKIDFLKESLDRDDLIGYIEYYCGKPVGFIEAFPIEVSRRLGFPVSNINTSGIMITCLSVRKEVSGYGVASRLIDAIELEVKNREYDSIEVLSFPDKHNWQPESLYEKKGYRRVKEIKDLSIMRKELK